MSKQLLLICVSFISFLSVAQTPVISIQPSASTVCENNSVQFKLNASNAVSYQWEVSTNAGNSYASVMTSAIYSGTATAMLTINGAPYSLNGYFYRCVVTGVSGNATSNGAMLKVNRTPEVTVNHSSQTICSGQMTSISLNSNVAGTSYSWVPTTVNGQVTGQTSGSGSNITQVLSGNGIVSYKIMGTVGSCQGKADTVLVIVNPAMAVSKQPTDAHTCKGDTAFFSVATANVSTYQWQVNKGKGFVDVPEVLPYSNTKTAALTIFPVVDSMDKYQFKLVLNGLCGGPLASTIVKLFSKDSIAPVFSKCPTDTAIKQGVYIYSIPVATDNCTKNVIVSKTAGLGSGANFPEGITTETYEAMDEAGNKTTCSFKVIVPITTVVKEARGDKQFDIYPNPAHQQINISTTMTGNYSLTIRDITGKIIMQNSFSKSLTANSVDLKDVAIGIYFITFQTDKSTQIEKLIIQ
ncbi:MAG TPA: T9SS type A sorting domain-containing protein [Bacteroidia bacterium]|jgi:hypothetical protein|nr:T9SS type A sorting domain-containing protein [Bacteroidia bacterium]